ncbi:zinc ribbon domain-containing protein [Paenibacillus sp. DMB20]|uniref:zinc ribbon domain-containing protein n=1 Tax=Paenibacillus sp. DMB20 TaxID=1642570 RepID=UPI00062801A3|nr:zinc ribbon domain-containing protein [Paenibacillus sp. DMB20]KKO52578.1 hypothetical protein XI25_18900 [Paenibacillus sp. DMB20]
MICTICGHENEGGQFCRKCGNKLVMENEGTMEQPEAKAEVVRFTAGHSGTVAQADAERAGQEASAGSQQAHYTTASAPQAHTSGHTGQGTPQPNPYLESAKQNSKIYFNYFVKGLKNPLGVAQRTGSEQFLNGIISIVLFVLILPLMTYLSIGSARSYMNSPFVDLVIKPVFWLAVFMLLVAVYTFGAVKLSTNPSADFREIIARYGTLLIPLIVIVFVGFLFIMMGSGIGVALMSIGMIGAIFTAPAVITMGYKRENVRGLDTLYAILLIYAAVFITMMVIGDSIGSLLKPTSLFGF